MKYLLLLLLLLNLNFSFTQTKLGIKKTNTSTIYIIDESWQPRESPRWKADESSYLQISGGYFVLSERTRGKDLDIEGDMESIIERGDGIHFWVKSGGLSSISCDIIPKGDKINIHLYHSVGRWDKYYSGHLASTEEVKILLQYIRKD